MAITKFIPEVWAAELLSTLSRSLVYAGAPCSNRNYEGDISAFGDTVHITSIADPSITPYVKDTDLAAPEALTDAERLLLIDQAMSFNFQIDDIDAAQTRNNGALMSEAAQRAAFGLRDKADKYVAGRMLGEAAAGLSAVDGTTATNVYDNLVVGAAVKLDELDVPTEGRWLVVDPATHGRLLVDGRFIKVNESGGSEGLRNGRVGQAGGFDIFLSNNAPVAARAITATITVATTAKTLTGAAGTFSQADIGLTVAGTRVTSSQTIASVNADGSVATMSAAGDSAGTQTDTVLSGAQRVAIAGSPIATSYAEQINKVEAYRPQARFADALKGLHLYGAKVVRPTALVVASVKVA